MRRHTATIVFLLCTVVAFAQEDADRTKPPTPEFSITTIPIRCVLRDYNIGFSTQLNFNHSLEFRIGYVHKNDLIHEQLYEPWLTSTEMHFHGPSFYVQWNKWKYNSKMKRTYWGLIGGYRYLWFHDRGLWKGGTGGSSFAESITLSQWRNDLLILATKGWQTSRVSTIEISGGIRLMYTHTHVSDTRFHPSGLSQEEYDAYRASQANDILFAEGFGILPVIRVTSRIGRFVW